MNRVDWNKEKENLKYKFEEEKLSIDDVANQYNVSVSTISNKCKLFNIKIPIIKNKTFLSEEEKLEFKKLFESGKSSKELKKLFNLSEYSFYSLVYNLNLRRGKGVWSEEEISELRECLDKGLSYSELEEIFKGRHTIQSIKGIVRDKGKKLGLAYQGNIRHVFTKEEDRVIIDLVNKGISQKNISEKLGLKTNSLKGVLKRHKSRSLTLGEKIKLGLPPRETFKPLVKLTKDNITKSLINNNYNRRLTANELGISVDTLKRRIKTFNIEIPSSSKQKRELYTSHRYQLLEKYLGHKPQGEELSLKVEDVISKEIVEQVFKDNNYDIKSSSNYLGISISEFGKVRKKYGILNPKLIRISEFSEEYFKKLYVDEGLTYYEISEITGLAPDTLRKYLKKKFPEVGKYGKYSSLGEVLVSKVLMELGISFNYNKRYKGYNVKEPERLYIIDFEFIYNKKKYWIEYNGKQHYEFIEYFYKTRNRFEKMIERDSFVSDILAKKVGADLLVIKYDCITLSDIREVIKAKLKL